jgi:hypothetical protein
MSQPVNLRPLKDFALKRLSQYPALRDSILSEKDDLDAFEFLVKVDSWLKFLNALERERKQCGASDARRLSQAQ